MMRDRMNLPSEIYTTGTRHSSSSAGHDSSRTGHSAKTRKKGRDHISNRHAQRQSPPQVDETVVSIHSLHSSASGRALRSRSPEISRAEMLAKAKRAIEGSMSSVHEEDEEASERSSIERKSTGESSTSNNNNRRNSSSSSQHVADSMVSSQNDGNTSNHSSSRHTATAGNGGTKISYSKVTLNKTVGTLSLTQDRLAFKPRDKRDKEHLYSWQLDALQKHQVSAAGTDVHLLKLISQSNPSKAVIMTFPDRESLESIHSHLSSKLQPLRKYRKLKETLLITQRKLKDANKAIDEMQDTNQQLLVNCEAFAKKCKNLSHQLQQQQQQIRSHCLNDERVLALQQQVETLHNERTAMAIGHEMDVGMYQEQVASLQKELREERISLQQQLQDERRALALERSTTERLLEERESLDQLRLEFEVLTKELLKERHQANEYNEALEHEQLGFDDLIQQVRQQRNNSLLEVAHLKKERAILQQKVMLFQEEEEEQRVREGSKEPNHQAKQSAEHDREEESLLGLDCLTVTSLEEPTQVLCSKKQTTTSMDPHRWAIMSQFLPVLLRALPPPAQPYPCPSWSCSTVVRPWKGGTQSCLAILVTGKSGGGNSPGAVVGTQLIPCWMNPNYQLSAMPAADYICFAGEMETQVPSFGDLDGGLCLAYKDGCRPALLDFRKGICGFGTVATHSTKQYTGGDPGAGSRRMIDYGRCTPSGLSAWSRYPSISNAFAWKPPARMNPPWMQGSFLNPIGVEVYRLDHSTTHQLYLPAKDPLHHQWDRPMNHQLYVPNISSVRFNLPVESAPTLVAMHTELSTQVRSTYSVITSAAVAAQEAAVSLSLPAIVAIPERCLR